MKHEKAIITEIPNILVVDDIGTNLKLLDDILRPEGYNIRLAPGGVLALRAAEKEKPDLILLDIMMPGIDGFEVCRQLKENPNLKDIPVIFISALGDTDDIVRALAIGGVDYITKPYQAEEIKARVHTHLKLRNQSLELQKLNNELQQQSKELSELNATKDKFFSIIAHDLRGPFTGFLGLTQIMAQESESLSREEIQEYSALMKDSAANLFRLLENLLEWARSQRGLTKFMPESLLLMPIITEIMRNVISSATKKGIEISSQIPVGLSVFADEYMLASTIRNLTTNAVKFTRKGGKVSISAKPLPGNRVEISVTDNGIGMKHEMVNALFQLDVQTNRKGTENEPSSGLGLLLCKEFVEKHGSKLCVESEEGKGSIFTFTITSEEIPSLQ